MASDVFCFLFKKKVIFADIRARLLSSGCGGVKRMVYWDTMQDKGKNRNTLSPLSELMHSFFMDFILTDF